MINISAGEEMKLKTDHAEIIFLTGGDACIVSKTGDKTVRSGQFILFPSATELLVRSLSDTSVMVIGLGRNLRLCSNFTINNLYDLGEHETAKHVPLDVHARIKGYLNNFIECVNLGMSCPDYTELKIKELFILMKMIYTREELAGFFAPLLSPDVTFSDLIFKNYRNTKNATELARLANLSMSAFKKKFKQVFGLSAQDWLMEQKEKDVLYDLLNSDKSLKEIAHEYHFATTSHLNNFCLNRLKMTPGRIRNGSGGRYKDAATKETIFCK